MVDTDLASSLRAGPTHYIRCDLQHSPSLYGLHTDFKISTTL